MINLAPFRTTVCGIDELESFSATRTSHVLSILDPDWPVPEAFGQFGEHEKLELRFHDVIEETPGQRAPQPEHVEALLAFGRDLMAEPPQDAHLLVHCHAGISRSTASMALILAQSLPQVPAAEILEEVARIREKAWPNLRMIELGDAMLGRAGTLVTAAHAVYRRQLERRTFLWEFMGNAGRQRELATATRLQEDTMAQHKPAESTEQGAPTDAAHQEAGDGTLTGSIPAGLTPDQLQQRARRHGTRRSRLRVGRTGRPPRRSRCGKRRDGDAPITRTR